MRNEATYNFCTIGRTLIIISIINSHVTKCKSSSSSRSSDSNKSNKGEDDDGGSGDGDGNNGDTGSTDSSGTLDAGTGSTNNSGSGDGGGAFNQLNLELGQICHLSHYVLNQQQQKRMNQLWYDDIISMKWPLIRLPQVSLQLNDAKEAIQRLIRLAEENAGMSQASIAERYSIAKSNVCRILQRKHEYLRAYEWAGFAGSRKRKLRGDPQQQQHHHHNHHHHQNQQSRASTRDYNNFQTLKMTNTTNYTVSHNHPTSYMELATSNSIEGATNDNSLIAPQCPTTIIQRGNETLRAHMYKQHQISRMFMCRCCNWAFPDKTSLHMHMQAKEEGKTISVPVIGKGNPPATHQNQHQQEQQQQQQNENLTGRHSPQLSTLHVPQPRVPATNPFAPLQLHSLVGLAPQQAISLTEQTSLQAAAATLFPPMALLRDASGSGAHVDDLMSKLRERLMLNNLVAQSSFGLAAWLSTYPKMDQSSGIFHTNDGNPLDMCSSKDSDVNMVAEEDEINVDKEYDDDMMTDRNSTEQQQSHIMEMNGKHTKIAKLEIEVNSEESNNNNNNSNGNTERPKSANEITDDKTSNIAFGIISSKAMPNLRSAINNNCSSKNSNLILKNDECKDLLNNISNNNINSIIISNSKNNNHNTSKDEHTISESSDPIESHISPSETHSSTSNGTSPPISRECYECAIYRENWQWPKIDVVIWKEKLPLFNTRVTASENSARQYEQEGRFLREQNEILQRKILECQEKTLAFMQADQATNAQAVALYLNDILKTTFLR
ncbi:putative zinc finger protein C06E1.8 [Dirofilaria immitis]|nr:putative zinc finger protein C06E1.8 [Dirofilaria immitis]